ncbi:MAG: ParB/RepB/Spo0J family partition protein [Phycisphaerales bacterium]
MGASGDPKSKPRRLGRGLSAMIDAAAPIQTGEPEAASAGPMPERGGSAASTAEPKPLRLSTLSDAEPGESAPRQLVLLDPNIIQPNPAQPRQHFDEGALTALAESIRRSGMMQPIVVRPAGGGGYELVAGERRWRAATMIGSARVPAVVCEADDREAAELALVENLQREDLNPIERGGAFRRLSERYGLSHEEIGRLVGLDRSSVTNLIRLTELDETLRALIVEGKLGMGHGRALLAVTDLSRRRELGERAAGEGWSVRRVEREAGGAGDDVTKYKNKPESSFALADLEQRLGEHLGTRVRIRTGKDATKGTLNIEFYGLDHFDDLLGRIGYVNRSV